MSKKTLKPKRRRGKKAAQPAPEAPTYDRPTEDAPCLPTALTFIGDVADNLDEAAKFAWYIVPQDQDNTLHLHEVLKGLHFARENLESVLDLIEREIRITGRNGKPAEVSQ